MSRDSIYSGALTGRFYRLGERLDRNTSLVSACEGLSWSSSSSPVAFSRTFCESCLPYEGDIGEDTGDLAYHDSGSGVWRMWLREETRKVSKMAVEQYAAKIALKEDPDTSLKKMQRSDRLRVTQMARLDLISSCVPQIRVVPIVVIDDLLWIGKRSSVKDRTYIHLLRQVVGDLEEDSLLWNDGGWSSCSYATLKEFCSVKAGELAPDVHLSDLHVHGRSIQVKASDGAEDVRKLLSQMTASVSETGVKRLSFEVMRDGVRIEVDADAYGVFRAVPMRSPGGLPHERVRRRFEDVLYAASRIKTVMSEIVARYEEEE